MCLRVVFLGTSALRRMDGGILYCLIEADGPQHRLWYHAGACGPQLTAG
jgi:hypothetical protein